MTDPAQLFEHCLDLMCGRRGVKQDTLASVAVLRKLSDAGYLRAVSLYGWHLARPLIGMRMDTEQSLELIRQAASQNEPTAIVFLQATYTKLQVSDLPILWQDFAFDRLREQLESAPDDPVYNHVLGMCYCDGIGVDVDRTLAMQYWKRAYELRLPLAMGSYGWGVGSGLTDGAAADMARAQAIAQEGADAGYSVCIFNLAFFYANEPSPNWALSEKYYQQAASMGDTDAMVNLAGLLMRRAEGDIPDPDRPPRPPQRRRHVSGAIATGEDSDETDGTGVPRWRKRQLVGLAVDLYMQAWRAGDAVAASNLLRQHQLMPVLTAEQRAGCLRLAAAHNIGFALHTLYVQVVRTSEHPATRRLLLLEKLALATHRVTVLATAMLADALLPTPL